VAELVAQAEDIRRRQFRWLVVAVRLVAAPAAAPPAAPPAAPAPAVKPKPIPPVKKQVVLPEKPKALEEPKPKPKPKPEPKPEAVKPKPKPKPEPEPRKPEPKPEPKKAEPKPEAAYEDVLAQLRSEAGPSAARPDPRAQSGAVAGSGRVGIPISPEEAAWRRSAKIHLKRTWVLAPGFRLQPLSALVWVRLDSQGNVLGSPRVERSSGNPWYDDSAVRAIQKASPLPAPPASGDYAFEFRPEDLF
jgi:colicin import membrane protein